MSDFPNSFSQNDPHTHTPKILAFPQPLKFTLDTNCITSLEKNDEQAEFIWKIIEAHKNNRACVALSKIAASENPQKGRDRSMNFDEFHKGILKLGIGDLVQLNPIAYFDVAFVDHCVLSSESMQELEHKIHQILFPDTPFLWLDYCKKNKIDPNQNLDKKWRNHKCDVLSFWCHVNYQRNIFVTSDENFFKQTKKPKLLKLAGGRIEKPATAMTLLRSCEEN